MSIQHWPEQERPREKLLTQGAASLSNAELLAILLGSGTAEQNAVDLGRQLLSKFGSLEKLLLTDLEDLVDIKGIGHARFARIKACHEINRRILREAISANTYLENPEQTSSYLQSELQNEDQEIFACLFLTHKHRIIKLVEITRGTICEARVYPREIVKSALRHHAAAVVFVHNHPSGCPKPSQEDIVFTQHLKEILNHLHIRVLDHIILGHKSLASMAEMGLIR